MSQFKKVTEASYLTADRAWSYRAILRYFYIQHERMREFLFPEEILAYLKEQDTFSDFTEEQLHLDLSALVKWGNLIARQEVGKVKSVEEFKKKRFRYQCTPYTVEFERMLQKLEGMGESFGGSLEKTQFERLYQALASIEKSIETNHKEKDEESGQKWEDVFTYFRKISQNTSDYLAYISSEEVEEQMQTEAFLVYKDQFTTYLRDFIVALQQTAYQIQELLERIDGELLRMFLTKVARHQEQTFRFEDLTSEDRVQDQFEKWVSLKEWFLGNGQSESMYEMLESRTNESIRRITRMVQRLGERHQHFHSRKKDYLHLAGWFAEMNSVKEAHELSSVAFGVFHTRHFHIDHVPSEDIYMDVWDEAPMKHMTKPNVKGYKEKTRAGAMDSHKEKKERMRKEHLEKRRIEQNLIEQYISGSEIRVEDLHKVETYIRKVLLSWLGKAMARKDRTIKTEIGKRVKVELSGKERITLHSEDGTLEMPNAIFHFVDEEVPHGSERV